MKATTTGHCECQTARFTVTGEPLLRLYCHCTICQEFNNAPYADICIVPSSRVQLENREAIEFNAYKKPPAVQRGKCRHCGKPAIEFFDLPLGRGAAIIPSHNLPAAALPEPALHMFYHRRVEDMPDDLPKYQTALSSHLGSIKALIPRLFKL